MYISLLRKCLRITSRYTCSHDDQQIDICMHDLTNQQIEQSTLYKPVIKE